MVPDAEPAVRNTGPNRRVGGELEQIQMLLGHQSVQTTERYLGTKQDLVHAPDQAAGSRLVKVRGRELSFG
jgi:integrase